MHTYTHAYMHTFIHTCRQKFRHIKAGLFDFLNVSKHGDESSRLHEELVDALIKKEMQNRAAWMIAIACLIHLFLWVFMASFVLYAIMETIYEHIPELEQRNVSPIWANLFLNMAAYTNGGFTITSDSMFQYVDKPGAYLWACVVVLAGNTLAPICLRIYVWILFKISRYVPTVLDGEGLEYALKHPRLLAYMMFDTTQTLILFGITISINLIQFLVYLACTLDRPQAQVCVCVCMFMCMCVCVCVFG
jgi:Trk-type K+ transport system membrane component